MIHELIIKPDSTPKSLRKEARKLAMTGGYEVILASDLTPQDLEKLYTLFSPELDKYPAGEASYKNSLAYRVLDLIGNTKGT